MHTHISNEMQKTTLAQWCYLYAISNSVNFWELAEGGGERNILKWEWFAAKSIDKWKKKRWYNWIDAKDL